MPAYLIVYRETPVRDEAAAAEYQRRTREMSPDEFQLKPRVVRGAIHPLEGSPPDAVIMLEFPSVEQARSWYNSPAYQEALPFRLNSAEYRSIIVEGF
jgi:uncharacterized protein (DUF1330 family)